MGELSDCARDTRPVGTERCENGKTREIRARKVGERDGDITTPRENVSNAVGA